MSEPEPQAAASAGAAGGVTHDAFLGGRVSLLQPRRGYRAATDPVLLAAACAAEAGDRVLDVGCGVGAAAFCLNARCAGLHLEGIEAAPEAAALSRRNAALNGASWRVHAADLREPPSELRTTAFDHVMTNPPFFAATRCRALEDPWRDAAHREAATLEEWIDFCLRRLRPKGRLTLIHRAERLPEILSALDGRAGDVVVLPLSPRPGLAAKRVIVKARKEARGPFRLACAFVLHAPVGEAFTPEASAVLRDGAALDF